MKFRRGRHRAANRRRGLRFTNSAPVDQRTIEAVLLNDGKWYGVINNSFAVSRVHLAHGTSQTVDLGVGFYFYRVGDGKRMAGQLTTILAYRQNTALLFDEAEPSLDLI